MGSTAFVQRLLVADDYPGVAQSIADVVSLASSARCRIDIALHGQESVDLALANRPNVALLDIEMPGLNGISAALAIRFAYAQNPPLLVGMTGGDKAFEAARTAAVFDLLLKKPIEMVRLFNILQLKP
jgi:two-component system response regulator DesR